jgi:hypothetical protein
VMGARARWMPGGRSPMTPARRSLTCWRPSRCRCRRQSPA